MVADWALEPYIPGSYEKYTTNGAFLRPDSELAQAFSHFTWPFSHGRMMVTDIQGVQATLTDPQIHSDARCFGRGNVGTDGMDRFLMAHKCGETCKHLNVKANPVQLVGGHAPLQTSPVTCTCTGWWTCTCTGWWTCTVTEASSLLLLLFRKLLSRKWLESQCTFLWAAKVFGGHELPAGQRCTHEQTSKSPAAAPEAVVAEVVTDSSARICWREAALQSQDACTGCRVQVWGPQETLHFQQTCRGGKADVEGLCANTAYKVNVAWMVGGQPGKATTLTFSTLAAKATYTPREDPVQHLCDGKCGTFVELRPGDKYLRQRSAGIYCTGCQEKVESTICQKSCARHSDGCRNCVLYSVFQLECRGDEVPVLCGACSARV
ncbi:unnamed protein product [Prorocentrum cordatum]|uniref:Alpha-type protein kinase domain-containing protein n=1 Tax=Prorocentrum cordatum TaxID=2364126 RepID=A0ABN9VZD1_9DINO|nr:unnamed protein product [Polarella glacialis]